MHFKRKVSIEAKIQAFIQLTRHIVYPLMLIQFLALPILLAGQVNLYVVSFLPAITIATYLAMGPGAYIMIMQGACIVNHGNQKQRSYLDC